MRRPLPPLFFAIHLLGMLALHGLWPGPQWIAGPWRWLGALPIAAGLALTVGGARLFDRHGTTVKPFEESSHLVVSGPYRFSRNPMYLGMVLMLVGTAIALGSTLPWLGPALLAATLRTQFIAPEERMLEKRFGEEYLAYERRVRRWL